MVKLLVEDPNDKKIEVFQGLRDHTLRRLRESKGGDMEGVFIAEGDLVVDRAIAAGYSLKSVLIDAKRTKPLPAAVRSEVPIYAVTPNVLQQITGYHLHRGMLACFARRPLRPVKDVIETASTVAVLENINNPTNLGTVLRCAAALGVEAILLDPTSCDPLYRRCIRVSMGEAMQVPYAFLDSFPQGLDVLKSYGFELLAFTPSADALPVQDYESAPNDKVALVFGAEGPGLTAATIQSCDLSVKIPMSGRVDSVNLGSAAAIAFYALQQSKRLGAKTDNV